MVTTWPLLYEKSAAAGLPAESWEPSSATRPCQRPSRLCGRSSLMEPASRICSHTSLTCGFARRVSSSAHAPPAVGIAVRSQGLVLLPVAISAYAARMPFCRASA